MAARRWPHGRRWRKTSRGCAATEEPAARLPLPPGGFRIVGGNGLRGGGEADGVIDLNDARGGDGGGEGLRADRHGLTEQLGNGVGLQLAVMYSVNRGTISGNVAGISIDADLTYDKFTVSAGINF